MNFSFMSSPETQERTGINMSTSEKKAYQQGEKEAKEAGFLDNLFHGLGDAIMRIFPSTPEDQSYDSGYHDARPGKPR